VLVLSLLTLLTLTQSQLSTHQHAAILWAAVGPTRPSRAMSFSILLQQKG
jgi:hypothetical protein